MSLKSYKKFKNHEKAFEALHALYNESVDYLCGEFDAFSKGKIPKKKVRAYYPSVRISTKAATRTDTRLSYGFVPKSGVYETTVTRTDLFDHYYKEQFRHLLKNHEESIEIGLSDTPIPVHFALGEEFHLESDLSDEQIRLLPELFDQPDLSIMDDEIANGMYVSKTGEPEPLSLFTAPRVDVSLMRLRHYTATNSMHFQNYVIFTNYQFYIDEFVKLAGDLMASDSGENAYYAFVEPGNKVTYNKSLKDAPEDEAGYKLPRLPQMPAYHLKRPDGSGITMVNIGVGPSNAKTITDHIAVLRPHAWLMLGHCAGLRNSQKLGDYVLAHGYIREDNVLYKDLHPSIPVPPLAEIQLALEQAVSEVTGLQGYELKNIMRTGTVATVDDRNWEFRSLVRQNRRLSQSRAIALDMESGTVAANGFRFRVPYGTLLCVSDKPLHGQLKLPGMADKFYRQRVDQHLQIGLRTMSLLREIGPQKLHSRKLRSFNEVAFQ
ncbi:MAG: AMP nucleosidase [Bdellovibrionales bacterium]